jgi:3-deoxy-D-manno-octulosonate 8-phosphate phosphatase (KDO 8-P phosphatase)
VKRLVPGVKKKAAKIKLILLDVDGVLTDGGIIIDERGVETKRFDVRDGQGIVWLIRCGIKVGFITGRRSNTVRRRAQELGVAMVYQGVKNKVEIYDRIKRQTRLEDEQIAYAGDDLSDLPLLRQVGLAITVRDSWSGLKPLVDYVTRTEGGRGAVREISELVLRVQGMWKKLVSG